ncbi:polysaccharide biosynthesis tyrosine autokinase [Microbacterium esteraromaticum]|uniref:Polysaccharide biosynthesis tyrosine autokinase n=1 Tax=Microbacterium esteraromaticum TaxID=57043 RepID=A0A7D8ABT4_9MICO|nr:polysaccharide biosynthesis tyrosine autokinase [Microbacterium esteraromaticum]QMU97401.1 polysaccharide biosynthesis tyrosine autokinase [Microbacterium esteraromaticum]
MELRDYANALKRHWLGIVLLTVLGLGAGFGWAAMQTPVYNADASGVVTVKPVPGEEITAGANDLITKNKVPTYLEMATWRNVAEKAAIELGLEVKPEDLVARIAADNPDGTPIIKITAAAASPEAARDLAEAWVNGLTATIDEREGDGSPGSAPVTVELAESAALPSAPSFPDKRMALLVGGVLGLGMGIAFALVRAVSDRRVRASDDVEQRLGTSVVGILPAADEVQDGHRLLTDDQTGTKSSYALREALRVIRTNLQFMDVDNPPRVIVVSSAVPGEGKSTVAANLAATLAANGAPVVLVDGDLRRPTVAKTAGVDAPAGLTDVLAGRAALAEVLQRTPHAHSLAVLTAGTIPPNPSEVLGSARMKSLLDELAQHATVIVDAPPLLAVTDGAVLAHQADGVLLVVSVGKTTYDLVEKARDALHKVHGRVLGIVLNRAPLTGAESSVYTYEYTPAKAPKARTRRARQAATPAGGAATTAASEAPAADDTRTRVNPVAAPAPADSDDFDELLRGATVEVPPRRSAPRNAKKQ